MKRVHKTDGCWLWTGVRNTNDPRRCQYGIFDKGRGRNDHQMTTAHRFAYESFVGPIPEGYEIDHLCRTTLCVRPDHLEAVTPRENWRRSQNASAVNARKTACPIGHLYSEHGYVNPTTGKRRCRTCSNARALAYYHTHKHQSPRW